MYGKQQKIMWVCVCWGGGGGGWGDVFAAKIYLLLFILYNVCSSHIELAAKYLYFFFFNQNVHDIKIAQD